MIFNAAFHELLVHAPYSRLEALFFSECPVAEMNKAGSLNRAIAVPEGAVTLSDNRLFHALFPETESGDVRTPTALYALSFIIRFRTLQFNLLQFERFQLADSSVLGQQAVLQGLLHNDFPGFRQEQSGEGRAGDPFLLAGFSASGVHLFKTTTSSCCFFDRYQGGNCPEPVGPKGVCSGHQQETWWLDCSLPESVQGRMSRFYADPENFNRFSGKDLQGMLNRFWTRYASCGISGTDPEIPQDGDAVFFGYQSVSDCRQRGPVELRQRFKSYVMSNHPDLGGGRDAFHEGYQRCQRLRTLFR